jgi:hypothetical protein
LGKIDPQLRVGNRPETADFEGSKGRNKTGMEQNAMEMDQESRKKTISKKDTNTLESKNKRNTQQS